MVEHQNRAVLTEVRDLRHRLEQVAEEIPTAATQRPSGLLAPLLIMLLMLIPLLWLFNQHNESQAALATANERISQMEEARRQQASVASDASASRMCLRRSCGELFTGLANGVVKTSGGISLRTDSICVL